MHITLVMQVPESVVYHYAVLIFFFQFTRYLVSDDIEEIMIARLMCVQNHSCDPNCNIAPVYINDANPDKPLLTIFTIRDVAAGEELCFSYFGEQDDEESKVCIIPCNIPQEMATD